MLNRLVSGILELRSVGFIHGDIQPKTVHLTNGGDIILINNIVISSGDRGYHKMLSNSSYFSPLSPIELKSLEAKAIKVRDDPFASDLWRIGITILCIICKCDFTSLYDWASFRVRYDIIKMKFDQLLLKGYSKLLIKLLSQILEETELSRIKLDEISTYLEGFTPLSPLPLESNTQPLTQGYFARRSQNSALTVKSPESSNLGIKLLKPKENRANGSNFKYI